ncbi:MAG: acylphosphatase [Acidiferrobacterales bacterium]|jgi:acylphosphatase|nr:acylphosphatase [Nitrospira sp.]MCZ6574999.1 acylphosphatase [Gammaproteobacteria bacterium]
MNRCRRYLISGKVQGVFFRASTQDTARQLQLSGFARNLHDGRVEVVACGDESSLRRLEAWLRKSPGYARVDNVIVEDIAARAFTDFEAR